MSFSPNSSVIVDSIATKYIYKCLKTSALFDGVVFGEYLFTSILPRYTGDPVVPNYNVDIWFTSIEDSAKFLASMGSSLVPVKDSVNSKCTQYHITKYNIPIALVSVFVSDAFPGSDSGILPITATTDVNGVFGFQSWSETPFPELLIKWRDTKSI